LPPAIDFVVVGVDAVLEPAGAELLYPDYVDLPDVSFQLASRNVPLFPVQHHLMNVRHELVLDGGRGKTAGCAPPIESRQADSENCYGGADGDQLRL